MTITASRFSTAKRVTALSGAGLLTALGLAFAVTPSASAAGETCHGLVATIVGTERGEEINGTAGDDVIVGLGGNDEIDGRGTVGRLLTLGSPAGPVRVLATDVVS